MLNPSNLFDLNIGWAIRARADAAQRRRVGRHHEPSRSPSTRSRRSTRPGTRRSHSPTRCRRATRATARDRRGGQRRAPRRADMGHHSQVGAWLKSVRGRQPAARRPSIEPGDGYSFGYWQTGGFLKLRQRRYTRLWCRPPGARSTTGTLSPSPGALRRAAYPMSQCRPAPAGHRSAATVQQRRGADDADHVAVGLPDRDRRLGGADSDAPATGIGTTRWPVPGTPRPVELYYSEAPEDIVKAGRTVPPMTCNEGPRSRFPSWISFDACVAEPGPSGPGAGIAPPRAEPIRGRRAASLLSIEYGNVQGGLRSSYVDVPMSTWYGTSTGDVVLLHRWLGAPVQAWRRCKCCTRRTASYVSKVVDSVRGT